MEFLEKNYFNTTTQYVVNSNTLSADNLLIKDPAFQYVSSGFNNDATTTTITINFDATSSVSRLALQGFNGKKFNLYYNGATANAFSLTTTAATTTSQWTNNSETAMFIKATSVNCTSVSLDIYSTQSANSEKAIGYFYMGDTKVTFDRIPTAKNYKPKKQPKEVAHKLSDGGVRLHIIDTKFNTKIKFKYITESFRDSLETVWALKDSFFFVAFETTTSWDEIFYEVVWSGPFDFYQWSEDSKTANFSGSITLNEV